MISNGLEGSSMIRVQRNDAAKETETAKKTAKNTVARKMAVNRWFVYVSFSPGSFVPFSVSFFLSLFFSSFTLFCPARCTEATAWTRRIEKYHGTTNHPVLVPLVSCRMARFNIPLDTDRGNSRFEGNDQLREEMSQLWYLAMGRVREFISIESG